MALSQKSAPQCDRIVLRVPGERLADWLSYHHRANQLSASAACHQSSGRNNLHRYYQLRTRTAAGLDQWAGEPRTLSSLARDGYEIKAAFPHGDEEILYVQARGQHPCGNLR